MSRASMIQRKAGDTFGGAASKQIIKRPVTCIHVADIEDAEICGRVLYAVFQAFADHHGFPRDFLSVDVVIGLTTAMPADPACHGMVAEQGGRFVGCHFIQLRPLVAGIGSIAVDSAEPVMGKAAIRSIVGPLLGVVDSFDFRELMQGPEHVSSFFKVTVGPDELDGMDYWRLDEAGLIQEMTVLWRPLPAAMAVRPGWPSLTAGRPRN